MKHFLQIIEEMNASLTQEEPDRTNVLYGSMENDDLWSPKKISPYSFPQQTGRKAYIIIILLEIIYINEKLNKCVYNVYNLS